MDTATYFPDQAAFHDWLSRHHKTENVLVVGFHKKDSGTPSITYPEALDEALCFGWIDGVRRRVDGERYTIRFTPRRKGSIWSRVNIRKVEELIAAGRMLPEGLAAFQERKEENTERYSFEGSPKEFDPARQKRFEDDPAAWSFFQAQPPSWRKRATHWVMSAKQEETKDRRLEQLMGGCRRGERF